MTSAWADCIEPAPPGTLDPRFLQPDIWIGIMSAETEALNEQIKQSVALLRRHL